MIWALGPRCLHSEISPKPTAEHLLRSPPCSGHVNRAVQDLVSSLVWPSLMPSELKQVVIVKMMGSFQPRVQCKQCSSNIGASSTGYALLVNDVYGEY